MLRKSSVAWRAVDFAGINKQKRSHHHHDFLILTSLKINCLLAILSIVVQNLIWVMLENKKASGKLFPDF